MLFRHPILSFAAFACVMLPCFAAEPHAGLFEKLNHLSPLPRIEPDFKRSVLASLPTEGEARTLSPADRAKLESAALVLRLHGRETDYIFKVVASPQARIAVHARFVVLVTDTALRLLTSSQLQALVAHEIGHEYVWGEYEDARQSNDWPRVRELELFCDGVALQTLVKIGAPPSALIEALRILTATNRQKRLVSDPARDSHPSLVDRTRFSKDLAKRIAKEVAR